MMTKRQFSLSGAAFAAGACGARAGSASAARGARSRGFRGHEDAGGMAGDPDARAVSTSCARRAPSALTSPLLDEHRDGIFACAGCELPLFAPTTKFDSGTGWPSFWEEIAGTSPTGGPGLSCAHGRALPPLRRASRSRLRRRAAADRQAPLHQRSGAGLPPRRRRQAERAMAAATMADPRHDGAADDGDIDDPRAARRSARRRRAFAPLAAASALGLHSWRFALGPGARKSARRMFDHAFLLT